MIIVKLMGGLGNQMFQYALGRKLADAHQTELKLDLSFFLNRAPGRNIAIRNYDLNIFKIRAHIISEDEMNKYKLMPKYKYLSYIRSLLGISPINILKEKQFHYDESVFTVPVPLYLEGYWQSEKYYRGIEDTIRSEFTFKDSFDHAILELAGKIQEANSVCLNFRRTDYVTNPDMKRLYAECGLDYCSRAVDIMGGKVINPHYFVFSDDIEWCQHHVKLSYPTTFVTHNYAGAKFEHYLHLMSLCKHFIIPNSTFAWWGAWLSTNPNKIVIAPLNWFNDKTFNTTDLIPEKWIRI